MSDQGKETSSVSEQEQQIASQALNDFRNAKFDDCLHHLKRLHELKPSDARISLNKIIAEFYQSSCCKTDELRKQLSLAKKQVRFSPYTKSLILI